MYVYVQHCNVCMSVTYLYVLMLCATHIPINALFVLHVYTNSSPEAAASVESLQCIQILQTYGANFGVESVHGATPMHNAAASGYVGPSLCYM